MIGTATQLRPDVDIKEALKASIRKFSPLQAARDFFQVQSTSGTVKVTGNSGSLQARLVMLDNIKKTKDVIGFDVSKFYDDESLHLQISKLVPSGVLIKVQFGTVLLSGTLPDDNREMLSNVRSVAGIHTVVLTYPSLSSR